MNRTLRRAGMVAAIPLSVYLVVGCARTGKPVASQTNKPVDISQLRPGRYAIGDLYCDLFQGGSVGCAKISESYSNTRRDDGPTRYYKTMTNGNDNKLWFFEIDSQRHEGILADLASTPEEINAREESERWHNETTPAVLRPENFDTAR